MKAQAFFPADDLRDCVRVLWHLEGQPDFRCETIMPSGCVELIFVLADPVRQRLPAAWPDLPLCFINGLNQAAVEMLSGQRLRLLGVQLEAPGAIALLRTPMQALTDCVLDAEAILPGIRALRERLLELDAQAGFELLSDWLRSSLRRPGHHDLILASGKLLQQGMPIRELAARIGYSHNHLLRLFHEHIGLTPARLQRIYRFNRSLALLHGPQLSARPLTDIAHACGYSDQAHFCREFQAMSGIAPGEYLLRKSQLPGHLYRLELPAEPAAPRAAVTRLVLRP